MGLRSLLTDGNTFTLGVNPSGSIFYPNYNLAYGGPSKNIKYPESNPLGGGRGGPLLGSRVSWGTSNKNADPTFEYGGEGYTRTAGGEGNTFGAGTIDQFIRGGAKYAAEAREIDFKRIKEFLKSPNGMLFLAKQVTLQSQNPRPQKIYNAGINTLASVAAAGVSNIRRGGILPSVGGFDLSAMVGIEDTYLGEVGGETKEILREKNFGLGDPGAPSSEKSLQDYININNPFSSNKSLEYDVYVWDKLDKVNLLPILEVTKDPINKFTKDAVPFRFEVVNQDKKGREGNSIIAFRAFLDSIGDNYQASLNEYKYNGRGESFYTYNKFNRKIEISFKIGAQSRHEMQNLYTKLNYLVAQTAPNYSSFGRIRTPWMYLTIGDWFQRIPGITTSVSLNWQKDYPWEIALDRGMDNEEPETVDDQEPIGDDSQLSGKDKDMLILPHVLDVQLSFQPIHRFTPSNSPQSPFIGIEGDGVHANWLKDSQPKKTDMSSIDKKLGRDFKSQFEKRRENRKIGP